MVTQSRHKLSVSVGVLHYVAISLCLLRSLTVCRSLHSVIGILKKSSDRRHCFVLLYYLVVHKFLIAAVAVRLLTVVDPGFAKGGRPSMASTWVLGWSPKWGPGAQPLVGVREA